MSAAESRIFDHTVNTARYPLAEPGSAAWQAEVDRTRHELNTVGCSVLPDFIRPESHENLRRECADIAPLAYYDVEIVNAYNIDVGRRRCPPDHPGRITMERGNAFVARDRIPRRRDHPPALHQRGCSSGSSPPASGCRALHELADPLAGLCLNVSRPAGRTRGTSTPTSSRSAC